MNNRVTYSIISIIMVIIIGYTLFYFFHVEQIEEADTKKGEIENVQLTFWRSSGTVFENTAYDVLISNFESLYPNIKITIPYPDYEFRLRTEIAAGNPPDIMAIDSPNLALYASSGSLLSIDDYMKAEGNIDDISATTLKELIYNEEIYLSPIVESGVALIYNIDLFNKAGVPFPSKDPHKPMTWDEVLEIAKKINNPSLGVFGIDPAQGFGEGEYPSYFKIPLLWQFGAEILNPDATSAEGYLNSKEALEALQFYQDLYQKHGVAVVDSQVTFESGKLGMMVLGSWTYASLEKNFPNFKLGEDFGVAPLPKAKKQVVPVGGWALGISSSSKHPNEAWKFINYITGYEGSKRYVELTGDIPARYSVAEEFPEIKEYPRNIFVQQAKNYSKNRPVTPIYPVVSEAIKRLFEDVGIGGKDVNDSAREAIEYINNAIKVIDND
jgi:fructooligosaccharide transport system substrate-binding protein